MPVGLPAADASAATSPLTAGAFADSTEVLPVSKARATQSTPVDMGRALRLSGTPFGAKCILQVVVLAPEITLRVFAGARRLALVGDLLHATALVRHEQDGGGDQDPPPGGKASRTIPAKRNPHSASHAGLDAAGPEASTSVGRALEQLHDSLRLRRVVGLCHQLRAKSTSRECVLLVQEHWGRTELVGAEDGGEHDGEVTVAFGIGAGGV